MVVPGTGRESTSTIIEQRLHSSHLLSQAGQECVVWPVQFIFLFLCDFEYLSAGLVLSNQGPKFLLFSLSLHHSDFTPSSWTLSALGFATLRAEERTWDLGPHHQELQSCYELRPLESLPELT